MRLEFDPVKSAENDRKRGLPFDMVADLDWSAAVVATDERKDYGETRFYALVPDDAGRLYVVCFTVRKEIMRVISFRKANDREFKSWSRK